jgi:hypothetical protein
MGFIVDFGTDGTHRQMERVIRDFAEKIRPGDVAMFYFSGHGAQVNGVNYLMPIDVNAEEETEIKYKAVPAELVLDKLDRAQSRVNLMVLDACRSNPFKRFKSLAQGLAQMDAPTGTLIAYATAPGKVALAGLNGENSPFTKHLLRRMRTPGLEVGFMLRHVREDLIQETGEKQIPWESSSIIGKFYFVPDDRAPSPRRNEAQVNTESRIVPPGIEQRFIRAKEASNQGNFELAIMFFTHIIDDKSLPRDFRNEALIGRSDAYLGRRLAADVENALKDRQEAGYPTLDLRLLSEKGFLYKGKDFRGTVRRGESVTVSRFLRGWFFVESVAGDTRYKGYAIKRDDLIHAYKGATVSYRDYENEKRRKETLETMTQRKPRITPNDEKDDKSKARMLDEGSEIGTAFGPGMWQDNVIDRTEDNDDTSHRSRLPSQQPDFHWGNL